MIWFRTEDPDDPRVKEVAESLASGGLAIVPTETVYGLACDALNSEAVERVFEAKGRPEERPLLVGVSGIEQAKTLVSEWPPVAERLASAFWPGPLSLVLPKSPAVPNRVTAGGASIGVRMPDHPLTLKLIELSGKPLVLTSANVSDEASPKTAEEAVAQLGTTVDWVVDSGTSLLGTESTVVDLTSEQPRIVRPGAITAGDLELP